METARTAPQIAHLAAVLACAALACGSGNRAGDASSSQRASGLASAAVTWTVLEGAAGGTVTGTGLYSAPSTTGTFHVVATSVFDPSKSGAATALVGPTPTVCDRLVPESVAPSIDCTPKAMGVDYDGCSGSNLACGPVHGCVLERDYIVNGTIRTTYTAGPPGYQPPPGTAAVPLTMRQEITGHASGWFTRGDGTEATGSCLLPPVKNLMATALAGEYFGNADWCGACVEVVGRSGKRVRIQIVTKCDDNPGCVDTPGRLDMASGADSPYEMLNLPIDPVACRDGRIPITWKIVPCETEGGIAIHYVDGFNQWTPGIQVRNHRLPIVKLEDYVDGGWHEIPREAYNVFKLTQRTNGNVDQPYTIRVTAIDGATITGTFPRWGTGSDFEASSQF